VKLTKSEVPNDKHHTYHISSFMLMKKTTKQVKKQL